MSIKPDINDCDRVLVVEGHSDLGFYAEMLEYVNQAGVYIQMLHGTGKLKAKLEAFLTPDLLAKKTAIGVVVDADEQPDGRIRAVSNAFKAATQRSVEHGKWNDEPPGEARIGFFVVPNGQQTGEIETLAWQAWANDDQNVAARECVDRYLACMSDCGLDAHSPDKGKISALLAVVNDDDPRLGPGARKGIFAFNRPEFQPLIDFLRGM